MSATPNRPRMTAAEIAAWVLAVGAFALYGLGEFARTTADAANMATASAWSSFGMAAVVVLLPAALILTGVRQLLPSLRDVLRGEKVADTQDS